MIPVQALCNSILKRSFDESVPVTPMKLQKILYFIYRDYYQKKKTKLFMDNFQPWQYGPVITSVYDEFKSFGAKPISRFAKDANGNALIVKESAVPDIAASINVIWAECKGYSGTYLSRITHLPNSAWSKAIENKYGVLKDEDILADDTEIS